ncbi:MBL fold metallo-hydrolase [Eisenibacter elegans]|jgi:glyoxylase-like metal-dependent hydrolase (beta-lactamase superfamily II)|uniref:MBL fold metallo-hydrolase n=1 Tax=Eisenibacter elegans TaxID=997 RepID=UPI0004081324|nr:MBL fold metallo-hydrolase [Eisenibacter elegans]
MSTELIRIPLPSRFAYDKVNVYLALGDTPTLIDCGEYFPKSIETLQAALADYGLKIQDLAQIILTHAHVDHMGAAGWLASQSGAVVRMSEGVWPWVADFEACLSQRITVLQEAYRQAGMPETMQQMFVEGLKAFRSVWSQIPPEQVALFDLAGGQTLQFAQSTWEVLYTPGHSVVQNSFYDAQGQRLISADAVLPQTPVAVVEQRLDKPTLRSYSLPQMLDTFEQLARLPVKQILPGHGTIDTPLAELLKQQGMRIEHRTEETLAWVRRGHHRVFDIAQQLYAKAALPHFFLGFTMTLGYLDLLEVRGLVVCEQDAQGWRYVSKS